MQITTSFEVPAPREQAWATLLDMERVAPCLPGATLTGHDGDTFRGRVKLKLGPILAQYEGTVRITASDPHAGSLTMLAQGSEQRGNGRAEATIRAQLTETTAGVTRVDVDTDLSLSGRAAQFGRSLLQDVSKKLIATFAENLAQQFQSDGEPSDDLTDHRSADPTATTAVTPGNLNVLTLVPSSIKLRVASGLFLVLLVTIVAWAWW